MGKILSRQISINFFSAFPLGLIILLSILHLAHHMTGINHLASSVLFLVGLLNFILFRGGIRSTKQTACWIVVGLIVFAYTTIISKSLPDFTDSGLYHFQSIRWIEDYPLVSGIANIHSRLGFNNSIFHLHAFCNVFENFSISHHVVNGVIWGYAILLSITLIVSRERFLAGIGIASAVTLLFLFIGNRLSSPQTDTPVFVFQLISLLYAVKWMQFSEKSDLIALISCLALLPTLKLSSAIYGLCITVFVVAIVLFRRKDSLKIAVIYGIFGSVLLVLWGVRSVYLSGYPLYPSTIGGLDLPWTIDQEVLMRERNDVLAWARMPGENYLDSLHNWSWMPSWFERSKRFLIYKVPFILTAAGVIYILLQGIKSSVKNILFASLLLVVGSTLFWFFTGPDPRFLGAVFWVIPIVVFADLYVRVSKSYTWGALLCALSFIGLKHWQLRPPLSFDQVGKITQPDFTEKVNQHGVKMNVTGFSKEGNPIDVWKTPVPAHSSLHPDLKYVDGDLLSGFTKK